MLLTAMLNPVIGRICIIGKIVLYLPLDYRDELHHTPPFMIFIFGYHPLRKTVGPVEEITCPNCNNTRHWLLGRMTYYINIFFLPIIPTNSTYHKSCPVCQFSQNITREEFYRLRDLAELNQEAVDRDMSNDEYEKRLKKLRP